MTILNWEWTINTFISHTNSNWTTDNNIYDFWLREFPDYWISFKILKDKSNTLIINIIWILEGSFILKTKLTDEIKISWGKIMVTVTWKDNEINLYINAEWKKDSVIISNEIQSSEIITLNISPLFQWIVVYKNLTIINWWEYNNEKITVNIWSSIEDYNNSEREKSFLAMHTDDTQVLSFDKLDNNSKIINIWGSVYRMKLLSIGNTEFEWQLFPKYDFLIEDISS